MELNKFLFSIDLEDIRFRMEDGDQYAPRVPKVTKNILDWLDQRNLKITFFTVGDIAENYPEIIQEIESKGHEIACHSYRHLTLDKQTKDEFQKDLENNIEAILKAGATAPVGYRAPVFSLTGDRIWAYDILKGAGIKYSSSVLPAKNPLFGWEGFGFEKKEMGGVLEIPISLGKFLHKTVPFAGGVYFRVLPFGWVKKQFKKADAAGLPILSYMHPYDFDTEQEKFMHPGINNSGFYNKLMYKNRDQLFTRLNEVCEGREVLPYATWLGYR